MFPHFPEVDCLLVVLSRLEQEDINGPDVGNMAVTLKALANNVPVFSRRVL